MRSRFRKYVLGSVAAALLFGVSLGVAGREVSLIEAIKSGNTAAARELLARRTTVNAAEADGTTALHWAAEQDDLPLVDALLGAGATVQAANRHGVTPLQLAATNGGTAI